jgi:hypothetical protein
MRDEGQTLFVLEQLQPAWLAGRARQLSYFLCTRVLATLALTLPFLVMRFSAIARLEVLAAGGVAGMVFGAIDFGLAQRIRGERRANQRFWISVLGVIVLLIGLGVFFRFLGLPYSPLPGFYLVAAGFAFCTAADVRSQDVKPAHSIRWSPRLAGQRGMDGLVGLVAIGLAFVTIVFAIALVKDGWRIARLTSFDWKFFVMLGGTLAVGTVVWAWRRPAPVARNIARTLALALAGASVLDATRRGATAALVAFAAIGGLPILLGVFRGFESTMIDPTRPRTSGAWFWLRAPLAAAMVAGLAAIVGVVALAYGSPVPFAASPGELLRVIFEASFLGATVVFLRFGGFTGVRHFVLRALLVRAGNLPPKAEAFFTSIVQGALMQKVGTGYRFVHALLLEHLASLAPNARR